MREKTFPGDTPVGEISFGMLNECLCIGYVMFGACWSLHAKKHGIKEKFVAIGVNSNFA